MILPFNTKLNGNETFFIEKIWKGLLTKGVKMSIRELIKSFDSLSSNQQSLVSKMTPKLHTIREDKKNRWKTDVMIDFYINVRQKNMFRFAPRIPVVSTQEVEIVYDAVFGKNLHPKIIIDGKRLDKYLVDDFAQNDGFDTIEDFLDYFDKDYKGIIIHWTDLRY